MRLIGLGLGTVAFLAALRPVLVEDRRRGLRDFMACSVVVYADLEPPPATRQSDTSLLAATVAVQRG